jgi:hypothetical protein
VHDSSDCYCGVRYSQSNKDLGVTVLVKCRINRQADGQCKRL